MNDRHAKVPCKDCPFRSDVTPFLHPERAEEIAYTSQNPYASFTCHKTLEFDEDGDSWAGEESLECAGRLSLMANDGYDVPEGFAASPLVYGDLYEMIDAYEEEWARRHERKAS